MYNRRVDEFRMKELKNKITGYKIALTPADLPPLRNGFIRIVHQTRTGEVENILNNGLIYNMEYFTGGKTKRYTGDYLDLTSMANAYYQDDFWNMMRDCNGGLHKFSDKKIIFDMPSEECTAHHQPLVAKFLSGKVSEGYIVGVIDNYGTPPLTLSWRDAADAKRKSLSNPLPPAFETPNWRGDVKRAWAACSGETAADRAAALINSGADNLMDKIKKIGGVSGLIVRKALENSNGDW